jgi:N-acetylglutamate synthase-like GNAT family acetyltransferase
MSKNRLLDLNDHLFAQMERLSDEDIKKEDLDEEIQRARAVAGVANQIINNARLVLEASKAISDGYTRAGKRDELLSMLGNRADQLEQSEY